MRSGEKQEGWVPYLTRKAFDTWGMDTRSLAFYRFLLAMVTIMDAIDRIPDLRAHYSDEGYVPRHLVLSKMALPAYVSLHMANGSSQFAFVLFVVQVMLAVFLLVGWRTRLMTFLTWYMNISLQARNPLVLHNGDVYVRMMLFFAMFLPLGAQWSIDKINSTKPVPSGSKAPEDYRHLSIGGSIGTLMQLNFVYFFAVLHKKALGYRIWFQEGSATYWALASLPYYRTPIGDFFYSLPKTALQYLTWAVLYWELIGWFFFIVPWKTHYFRLIGILGFFALHAGFGSCMRLEQFVWMGCSATMCLLPPWIWDVAIPRLRERFKSINLKPITITYSPRCLPLVQLIDTFFLIPHATFIPLQSRDDEAAPQGIASALVVECPSLSYRTVDERAVVMLLYWSPVLWPLYFVARTSFALSAMSLYFAFLNRRTEQQSEVEYRVRVARPQNRQTFLHVLFAVLTSKMFWSNALGIFFVAYVTCWNGANVGLCSFPDGLRELSHAPMLYQSWQMFSPPPQHIYHHNIEMTLKNGTSLELIKYGGLFNWEGGPMHLDPPLPWYPNYGDHRHWKYWENYNWHSDASEVRLEHGRWICREWNRRHTGDQVVMRHKTHYFVYGPEPNAPRQKSVMWDHSCF